MTSVFCATLIVVIINIINIIVVVAMFILIGVLNRTLGKDEVVIVGIIVLRNYQMVHRWAVVFCIRSVVVAV